ncbi:glycoside hydrolase family 64 protein [Macroventuria anomochaeta]|uniref:Glycoside hydrolase family 64 protein n=1 Tax=Macroventuria anomochaeta TaxID=301207 RepID=A0ACB6RVV8_9PLEO|nr:glycoside hydrolase family 64 protein [Macroventuria anomochaeta]KAF2625059.1 glycoside hydrolase family 64 protein [Macroventuria anomochaeta]
MASTAYAPPAPAAVERKQQQVLAADTSGTLQLALQNRTNSSNVFAYITGLSIVDGNRPIFIQADGRTVYSPPSPEHPLANVAADVAIPLGAPGNTVTATIPKIAGGRIWFVIDARLTFFVNPGPNIVNPSVTNPSDPNYNLNWTFAEFTYNDQQLFANISYVDFISIPVALSLTTASSGTLSVPGMGTDGFQRVVDEMRAQTQRDGKPWDQLIFSINGVPLRVLNPTNLLAENGNAWSNYWDGYVSAVWEKYRNEDLTINTQAAAGNITGRVVGNELQLGAAGSFSPPSSADIFTCSTGPFQTGQNLARDGVIPRLAAAFNRSQLLNTPGNQFPNGGNPSVYYQDVTTNHYSRAVHAVQRDGRGYAFPYDDVVPDGGQDVAGTLHAEDPQVFTIAVGGN